MAKAFKCDVCKKYVDGDPHVVRTDIALSVEVESHMCTVCHEVFCEIVSNDEREEEEQEDVIEKKKSNSGIAAVKFFKTFKA